VGRGSGPVCVLASVMVGLVFVVMGMGRDMVDDDVVGGGERVWGVRRGCDCKGCKCVFGWRKETDCHSDSA